MEIPNQTLFRPMVQGELEMKSEVATIFPVPIMIFDLKGHKDNDKLLEIITNWDEHKEHPSLLVDPSYAQRR